MSCSLRILPYSILLFALLQGPIPDLQAQGFLEGVVVDADGEPLEGVLADAWTWYRKKGNQVRSDEQGRFLITNIEPGKPIQVQFTKQGYGPRLFADRMSSESQAADETGDPWQVVMRNDTYLEGTVVDGSGNPAPGAKVRARRGPIRNPEVVIDEVWTTTTTEDDGSYRLYLEPDTYDLLIRDPRAGVLRFDDLEVEEGDQRTLTLRATEGIEFRAQVVDSETGEPVEGIKLFNWQQKGVQGISDERGKIVIKGMTHGEFEFNIGFKNWRPSAIAGNYARWWSAQASNGAGQQGFRPKQFQRNIDSLEFNIYRGMPEVLIEVEPCVTITGVVVTPSGIPIPRATVSAARTGTGNSLTGDTRYSRQANKKGNFKIKLPASGDVQYNLVAHDGKFREWRGWANGVSQPLSTKPGQVIGDMRLTLTKPAVAKGRVVDSDGQPVAGKRVRAVPTDGLSDRYFVPEVETDAEGHFTLEHIRPGKNQVQVEPFWLRAEDAPDPSSVTIDASAEVPVDGIELRIVQPQPITIGLPR